MTREIRLKIVKHLFSLLKPVQKKMFNLFFDNKLSRKYIIHCARRLGKTFLLIVIACCLAYSKADAQIRYASVTQKAVRKMVKPIFKTVFLKVKKKYRPKWDSQEGAYIFPNGSMIHVAGVNNDRADDLRGTAADLAIVDEAAFVDELGYLIESVLMPQLLTTGGNLLIASSSPVSPAHEFVDYIQDAKINGFYSSFDIYQSGYDQELIAEFEREAKGPDSTAWRREYLNEICVDDDYAIIPEHRGVKIGILYDLDNHRYFHKYDSMDIGTRDLTVVLFGFYDFKRATLCIQKEFVINGPQMTTPKIADGVKSIEDELWPDDNAERKRIADNNNLLLLQDLGFLHDCHFIPTSKDNLEAMVNEMRLWFQNKRIEIDPSCVTLIESIQFGFWNENRSDWGRSKTLGHFDALAALMYLIRNIDQVTNPIPLKLTFDQVCLDNDNNFDALKNITMR